MTTSGGIGPSEPALRWIVWRERLRRLAGREAPIPVVLSIDAEPDPRVLPRHGAPAWDGLLHSALYFENWRRRLAERTGAAVRFSWFVRTDPQIEACYGSPLHGFTAHPQAVAAWVEAGDELAVHVHPQHWDDEGGDFVVDHGDTAWIAHAVGFALEAFRREFGRLPRAFRFGDGWTSQELMRQLEASGVRWELTAEPGAQARECLVPGEARYTGALPGWQGIPRTPYRPDPDDYRRESIRTSGLWILPVSSGTGRPGDAGTDDGLPFRSLNLSLDPEIFRGVVDDRLADLERPYLALMVRTDVVLSPAGKTSMDANLEYLLDHPEAERFRWSTPGEALALLGLEP